jgi:hypothetical protein
VSGVLLIGKNKETNSDESSQNNQIVLKVIKKLNEEISFVVSVHSEFEIFSCGVLEMKLDEFLTLQLSGDA